MRKALSLIILLAFLLNTFGPLPTAQAQELRLPPPGVMVHLSPPENPPVFKGVTVYPDNPFKFNFILDRGDFNKGHMSSPHGLMGDPQQEQLKQESSKLVKYFLAAITTSENDLWVNLSPYEKNRIIPESFGQTDMGRDLLAEDYILKQVTASLIYPESEIGRKFWKRVYEEAQQKFGTTNMPVNTFNKVWIVPDQSKVYVHGNTAFVVKATLKVMLEEDYLSLEKHTIIPTSSKVIPAKAGIQNKNNINTLGSQIVREIVIPLLEKEVNEGQNFAVLRQVYYSLILAVWFKKYMKDSILGRKYMDQNKVTGIHYDHSVILSRGPHAGHSLVAPKDFKAPLDSSVTPQNDIEAIYQRYLKAFKKGVYNYIKEEPDLMTQEMIPRKYFSGGFVGELRNVVYEDKMMGVEIPKNQNDFEQVAITLDNAITALSVKENTDQAIKVVVNTISQIDKKIVKAAMRSTQIVGFVSSGPDSSTPIEKVIEKEVALNLIKSERKDEIENLEFDIRTENGESIGGIDCSVNHKEKVVSMNRIFDEEGRREEGYLIFGLALFKMYIIENGYRNWIINFNYTLKPKEFTFQDKNLRYFKDVIRDNFKLGDEAVDINGNLRYSLSFLKKDQIIEKVIVHFAKPQIDKIKYDLKRGQYRSNESLETALLKEIGHGERNVIYKSRNDPKKEFYKVTKIGENQENSLINEELIMNEMAFLIFLNRHHVSGVPKFLAWGRTDDGRIWIRMEGIEDAESVLVQGEDGNSKLSDIWIKFSLAQRIGILADLAEILWNLQNLGISHNDVKPQNILVNADGKIMLIDFGFSGILGEKPERGTEYFSPLNIEDRRDLYSFLKVVSYILPEFNSYHHERSMASSLMVYDKYSEEPDILKKKVVKSLSVGERLLNLSEKMTSKEADDGFSTKDAAIELREIADAAMVIKSPSLANKIYLRSNKKTSRSLGGIDLTAKRMKLEVDSDKAALSQPMDLKALGNIEINGLYIKDIEIKPLNNLPQLLGFSSR